jgi:hypothetical protein
MKGKQAAHIFSYEIVTPSLELPAVVTLGTALKLGCWPAVDHFF